MNNNTSNVGLGEIIYGILLFAFAIFIQWVLPLFVLAAILKACFL